MLNLQSENKIKIEISNTFYETRHRSLWNNINSNMIVIDKTWQCNSLSKDITYRKNSTHEMLHHTSILCFFPLVNLIDNTNQ